MPTSTPTVIDSQMIEDDSANLKAKKVLEVGSLTRRLRRQTEAAEELPSSSVMIPTKNDEDGDLQTQPISPQTPTLPSVNPRRAQQQRLLASNSTRKSGGTFVGGLRAVVTEAVSNTSSSESESETESEDETDDEEESFT
eukprot:3088652-Rhodomonas_salina.4